MASKINSDIYSQVKRLEIETNHIINSTLAGDYSSAFKGQGIEFEEVRPYIEGDEIRFIDWNVTAKMSEPYVKVFREEREISIYLLVDISSSMFFGTASETKKELMLKISALLSLVSMKNNDRVGLMIFTDKVEKVIPPRKGRKHVLRLIEELLNFQPIPAKTDINKALEYLNKLKLKKSVVFLLSDYKGSGYQKSLEITARKHDIVPIVIKDRMEETLKGNSFLRIKDLESRQNLVIDLKDPLFLANYQKETAKFYRELKEWFVSKNLDHLTLTTGEDYLNKLIQFFKRRIRRRQF